MIAAGHCPERSKSPWLIAVSPARVSRGTHYHNREYECSPPQGLSEARRGNEVEG